MGQNIQSTFNEMMNVLHMTYEEHIKAVRTTSVRPKLFLPYQLCEIRINNYVKHCLEFCRVNHDIQPSLDPFGMIQYIQYILLCHKGSKGNE